MKGKAFNNARNLCRVNNLLPMKTKIQLYNSYVASQLSYADVIWGGCSQQNKEKLQKVQNFCLRSMTGRSSDEARSNLNFLTLEEKRNIHYGTYVYKMMNGLAPENQTRILNQHKPTSQRITEQGILKPPMHKTKQFEMSTLYKGIQVWNNISPGIKASKTLTEFKNQLQKDACMTTH